MHAEFCIMLYNKICTVAFAEYPSNSSLLYEFKMVAVLRCRHQSTEAFINWLLNGLPYGHYGNPDIRTGSTNDSGTIVNMLTIPATPEYNGTAVVCVAFLDGFPPVSERTPAVMLTLVGGLLLYTNNELYVMQQCNY